MPKTILILASLALIAALVVSCGDKTETVRTDNKLAVIAIQEDMRTLGDGEVAAYTQDPNPEVRLRAVRALGRMNIPETPPFVIALLRDSIEEIRAEAAFALGQMRDEDGMIAMSIGLTKESSGHVRATMIEALGKIRNQVSVATVRNYMNDPDPEIRGSVALALANLRGHNRTEDLIILSRDTIENVRWKAAYAMWRSADSSAIGRLKWCLKDSSSLVRQFAARALGSLGKDSEIQNLTDRLRLETSDLVKIYLIRSIAQIGNRKTLKALLNILESDDPSHVKAEAMMAIGELRLETARSKIEKFLESKNRLLRGNAIVTHAQLDSVAFPAWAKGKLKTAGWYDKLRIIQGLRNATGPESAELVLSLVSDEDFRVRRAALESGLALSPDDRHDLLEKGIKDPDYGVNVSAIMSIVQNGLDDLYDDLAKMYKRASDNVDIRQSVVEGFAGLADSNAPIEVVKSTLTDALEDNDLHVRVNAIAGLRRFGEDHLDKLGTFATEITPANYDEMFGKYSTNPKAVITTSKGTFEFELLYDDAPKTVNNFIKLAKSGYFDGQIWPRAVPGFVIQGGCPRGDRMGGPGYTMRSEWNRVRFERGTVGMAHGGKDTGGSQFFVAHTTLPHLDGGYTVFGKVIKGMRVVDRVDIGDTIEKVEIVIQ